MNKALIAFAIIGLALLLVTFRPLNVSVHNPASTTTQPTAETHQDHLDHSHDLSKEASHEHQGTESAEAGSGKTGNPHFDQLSPEMQQALKDKLLLEGPMETYQRPDGVIVLPSNGRFTQMPVAVQMPDGSIQIREYSTLPQKTPSSPKSK